MSNYNKLNEIYRKSDQRLFPAAITYVVENGTKHIKSLTDESINSFEGNEFMTEELVQYIAKLGREIAQACDNPCELIQFCQVKDMFETRFYAGFPSRMRCEELASRAMHFLHDAEEYGLMDWEEYASELDLDFDEFEYFELPEIDDGFEESEEE